MVIVTIDSQPHLLDAPSSTGEAPLTKIAAVAVQGVSKVFGTGERSVRAVDDVTLDIVDGEFFCLLGPSGSGKTTLLRLVAGFEIPSAGRISLFGRDVTRLAPFDRDVNTVFQDYALFPHMTVQQNVEYGLKVKRVPRGERAQRAKEALESVQLSHYGDRKPQQLSGGQRQRVALARALVNRPKVLLLDEPLGALDLKLRQQMQVELKTIQTALGITFVFVTHDQEEALSMSDRLAVFNNGRVEQVGTPIEIYERPQTSFVAGFVGISNIIQGDAAKTFAGRPGTFSIRPEKIRVHINGLVDGPSGSIPGIVEHVEYLGAFTRYRISSAMGMVTALAQNTGNADGVTDLVGRIIAISADPSSLIEMQ